MPTNFVLAHVFMYLSRYELQQDQKLWTTPLKLSWLFSALIFCPITGWSFYEYPAWATVYLRPEFLIPVWSGPLIVSHYFLGMVLGTWIAQSFIQKKDMKSFWVSFAVGIFWLVSLTILTFDEYQHIGTYNSYHAGQAQLIFENPDFMKNLNLMGLAIAAPALALAVYLYKRSQKFLEAA